MLGILEKDEIINVGILAWCVGMMLGIFDKEGIEEPRVLGWDDG